MSCRDILAQLRQIQDPSRFLSEAQSYANQARALRNTTVTASNKDKIINDANQILAQLEQLKQQRLAGQGQLGSLLAAASREKCDDAIRFGEDLRIRYTQAGNEGITAGNITNQAKSTANAFGQETKAAESAAKQDNAGTGTPGTAGTGPGATPPPAPSPTTVANATPTANTTATTAATGPVTGKTQPTTIAATGATGATGPVTGTTAPKTVGASPPPTTKTVPATKGTPGTVEYIASLIAQQPVKGDNALATACPDKAKATATVKKLIADLNAQIAAQIPTAKGADGKPATKTAKDALSAQLQSANSKLSKTLKDIEAKNCTKEAAAATGATGATDPNTNTGLQGQRANTRAQATIQDTTNFEQVKDWRVRLRLSPGADYLYKAPESQQGILKYLNETDGVVFPYTPTITVSYSANYDHINPTHSNYKVLQYTNSSVDSVSISCDFTAQDTREANYLLAVIHFFRSVTKMFYGQDQNPKPGTPPPLVYLFGLGEFQFNAHPLVVTNFNYALPSDVDYIRAGAVTANPGVSREPSKPTNPSSTTALDRLKQGAVQIGQNFLNSILPGGESAPPSFTPSGFSAITAAGTEEPTYVPTKINLQIQCMPIVSRNDVSNRFSVAEYASGKLLRGIREKGGGFW